jgi:long-chain fatty acid transport protein
LTPFWAPNIVAIESTLQKKFRDRAHLLTTNLKTNHHICEEKHMMTSKRLLAVAISAALYAPLSAFATNGMNMEGYGPIATGMGGASMAYDNGTAAMANNVATLGLADDGNRIDVVLGSLSPDVHADAYTQGGMSSGDSESTQFFMPAMGWSHKSGNLAYGAGVFAQGGMGTEYKIMLPDGTRGTDRSEVGVGRFIIPVAYNVNDKLTVGASLDYVWATMDLQMTAPGAALGSMVTGGTMAPALPGMMTANTYGRFDFSDSNDFSGEAQGAGLAGKLGMTYKLSPALAIGFNYQSETAMDDLETGTSDTLATFYNVDVDPTAGVTIMNVTLPGKVTVKDFQWPQTFALGMSWKASDALMVVADVKQIQWSEVMENFKMTFTADSSAGNVAMGMAGATLDVTMPQKWDDQTVIQLGAAYKFTPAFTGRAGLNLSSNPIPDQYVNPLFPAIVENHLTLGAGYAFNKASDVNFSMTYAPEVEVTSPTAGKISHAQMNWQMMYSHRF